MMLRIMCTELLSQSGDTFNYCGNEPVGYYTLNGFTYYRCDIHAKPKMVRLTRRSL
jgi:hypothetical protein